MSYMNLEQLNGLGRQTIRRAARGEQRRTTRAAARAARTITRAARQEERTTARAERESARTAWREAVEGKTRKERRDVRGDWAVYVMALREAAKKKRRGESYEVPARPAGAVPFNWRGQVAAAEGDFAGATPPATPPAPPPPAPPPVETSGPPTPPPPYSDLPYGADTWQWNGSAWVPHYPQILPPLGPPAQGPTPIPYGQGIRFQEDSGTPEDALFPGGTGPQLTLGPDGKLVPTGTAAGRNKALLVAAGAGLLFLAVRGARGRRSGELLAGTRPRRRGRRR